MRHNDMQTGSDTRQAKEDEEVAQKKNARVK